MEIFLKKTAVVGKLGLFSGMLEDALFAFNVSWGLKRLNIHFIPSNCA